jgi:hypothetical protein
VLPAVFFWAVGAGVETLKWGIGLGAMLTVGTFSFWGNYLPRVYPTHLRGTGESFAANIGGRMIGTSAAYLTTTLANTAPGAGPSAKLAWASGVVALGVFLIGVAASFKLPEPASDSLPE